MKPARLALSLTLLAAACGGTPPARPPAGGTVPVVGHVFIVVEENADYTNVIDSPAMPYLNGLATRSGLATQYYANTHPSIGNYFMMTVGKIVTNNDGYSGTVSDDNIVRHLLAAGKTWKAYAEDLPAVGYHAAGDSGKYASRHNPLSYLSDVVNDAAQLTNLVPFSQFGTDLANNALPNYAFIVPNLCNDAHDCPLATADAWLQTNIDPLITSPGFQQDGLLIILFDESRADLRRGGGRIAWVVVGAKVKPGYRSAALYQHENTLRLTAEALGLTTFPNAAADAANMAEFFVTP